MSSKQNIVRLLKARLRRAEYHNRLSESNYKNGRVYGFGLVVEIAKTAQNADTMEASIVKRLKKARRPKMVSGHTKGFISALLEALALIEEQRDETQAETILTTEESTVPSS